MKKQSCRRTSEEKHQHEMAIKIRKMTDSQICEYMDKLQEQKQEPVVVGVDQGGNFAVADFISKLDVCGIGKVTIKKLQSFAIENGFM